MAYQQLGQSAMRVYHHGLPWWSELPGAGPLPAAPAIARAATRAAFRFPRLLPSFLGQSAMDVEADALPWFAELSEPWARSRITVPTPAAVPAAARRAFRWSLLPELFMPSDGPAIAPRRAPAAFARPRFLPAFLGNALAGWLSAVGKIVEYAGQVIMVVGTAVAGPAGAGVGGAMVLAGKGMQAVDAGYTVYKSLADQRKPKPATPPPVYSASASPISVGPLETALPEAPAPAGSPESPVTVSYTTPGTTSTGTGDVIVGCFIPAGVWSSDGVWHPGTGLRAYANDPRVTTAMADGGACTVEATGEALVYDPASGDVSIGTPADADLVYEGGEWSYWDGTTGKWVPVSIGQVQVAPDQSLSWYDGSGWQPLTGGESAMMGSAPMFYGGVGGAMGGGYAAGGPGFYQMEPGMGGVAQDGTPQQWTGSQWQPLPTGTLVTDAGMQPYLWDGSRMLPTSALSTGTTGRDADGAEYVWDGAKWVTAAEYSAALAELATGALPAAAAMVTPVTAGAAAPVLTAGFAEYLGGVPGWVWIASAGLVLFSLQQDRGSRRRR